MKHPFFNAFAPFLLFICLVNVGFSQTKKKSVLPAPSLKDDLTLMLSWFEGEFNNFQQVHKEKEDKVAEVHEHIHSIFKPVSLPAFGPNVFYVMQYMDGNPKKIYRQRLYTFTEDATEKAIRLDIYSFATDSLYYGADKAPEKLSALTPAQLTNTAGCGVYWKKDGEQFWGYMKDKACSFVSKRSGKKIFVTDSLRLTKNEIWIRDEAFDEDGKYVFGHKAKIHHKLKRCSYYKGWFALEKAGLDAYESSRTLLMHDQGGRVRLLTNEGKPMKYTVELSKVIYGKDQEVLKMALYEDGKDRAIDYSWASSDARMIGINMRWFSAGLTRE
jgi:hypothetical protein